MLFTHLHIKTPHLQVNKKKLGSNHRAMSASELSGKLFSNSQSQRWSPGVCVGLSEEVPPVESGWRQTFLEACAEVCGVSHHTFHLHHGCRREAAAEKEIQTAFIKHFVLHICNF